jgi:hypothetical protein
MQIVISVLSTHPLAWIRVPTADEVASFQWATVEKYPSPPDIWGACDGAKMRLATKESSGCITMVRLTDILCPILSFLR